MQKIDFQKKIFQLFQKCVFQFFDDLCGRGKSLRKVSPIFGKLLTSAISWWFQK